MHRNPDFIRVLEKKITPYDFFFVKILQRIVYINAMQCQNIRQNKVNIFPLSFVVISLWP